MIKIKEDNVMKMNLTKLDMLMILQERFGLAVTYSEGTGGELV